MITIKPRHRRNRADPATIENEVDLLRAILTELQFNNSLQIMNMQYFLLQSTECNTNVKRAKMKRLTQVMDTFLDEYTEEENK